MHQEVKAPDITDVCVHLKIRECPTCKAEPVSYSRPWRHAHGEYCEELGFKCGCTVKWSPNFSCMQVQIPCPESPEAREKYIDKIDELQNMIDQARDALHEFDRRNKQKRESRR